MFLYQEGILLDHVLVVLQKVGTSIDIMNTVSFYTVIMWNHEFSHVYYNTLLQLEQVKPHAVLGKVFYQNSNRTLMDKPYAIIEKDGVKNSAIILHCMFVFKDAVYSTTHVGI